MCFLVRAHFIAGVMRSSEPSSAYKKLEVIASKSIKHKSELR